MIGSAGGRRVIVWVGAVAMAVAGCRGHGGGATSAGARFSTAIVTKEQVAEAAQVERELGRRYNTPAPGTQASFVVLPGTARVLVVAGHATAHVREGKPKEADAGTGSLAVMVNRLARCPTIHTIYRSASDPNYYDDNPFKAELARMVERHRPVIVLDLHGSNSSRPYDVDFGTIERGASLRGRDDLLARLAACLREEGMRNFSQDFFPASRDGTVTRFVSEKLGVPCVQVEINQNWLITSTEPELARGVQYQRFAQVLQGIVRFVRSVDQSPGGGGTTRTRLLPSKISATRPAGSTTTERSRAPAGAEN